VLLPELSEITEGSNEASKQACLHAWLTYGRFAKLGALCAASNVAKTVSLFSPSLLAAQGGEEASVNHLPSLPSLPSLENESSYVTRN